MNERWFLASEQPAASRCAIAFPDDGHPARSQRLTPDETNVNHTIRLWLEKEVR